MKRLTPSEMLLAGGGRCGGAWSSIFVESTLAAGGALVGFGISFGTPIGAMVGANAGLLLGGIICRGS